MDISTGGRAYLNAVESTSVQTSTTGIESGLQKWAERTVSPDMFATPDSCIICFSPKPTAKSITSTGSLQVLGLAQGVSFGSQVNVLTFQELRTERHIIIPLKTTPGQLSIARLMGAYPSLQGMLTSQSRWVKNNQKSAAKKLCCIILIFMNQVRNNTLGTLIFERCALTSDNTSINAGEYSVLEQLSFTYDKIIDSQQVTATPTTQAKDTSTTAETSTDIAATSSSDVPDTFNTSNLRQTQVRVLTNSMNLETQGIYQYALRKINQQGIDRNSADFSAYQDIVTYYESNLKSGFETLYVQGTGLTADSFDSLAGSYATFKNAVTTYKGRGTVLP